MRVLIQSNDDYNMLTCYTMIMDRSIHELIYLLKHDPPYELTELDFIATRLGYAPVHFSTNLEYPDLQTITRFSWPNRMIITDIEQHSVVYDPTEEMFYDPRSGLRPINQLPTAIYITPFFFYQVYYDEQ